MATTTSVAACLALLVLPLTAQSAELLGRAVLPAATFSPRPASGQFIAAANGISVPFQAQPMQGFSAVLPGPATGQRVAAGHVRRPAGAAPPH